MQDKCWCPGGSDCILVKSWKDDDDVCWVSFDATKIGATKACSKDLHDPERCDETASKGFESGQPVKVILPQGGSTVSELTATVTRIAKNGSIQVKLDGPLQLTLWAPATIVKAKAG